MSARLTFVCHSSTSATNTAGFSSDEPLDGRGAGWAADARTRIRRELGRVDRVRCSPARACRQTAAALQLDPDLDTDCGVEPLLRDWDFGRWRGHTLDEVAAHDPAAVQAWLSVPSAAPHGGESLTGLFARVGDWLAAVPPHGHTVAVTHAAIVRAAIAMTLSAAPEGFWRIDVAPLAVTVLCGGPARWTLRLSAHRTDAE